LNQNINKKTTFIDLGLIDYQKAWHYQTEIFNQTLAIKSSNRAESNNLPTDNFLIFCEHPHVFTLGKSGNEKNLLLDEGGLAEKKASYYHINRGGDITYHGPGQLVGYPVIDLENFFTDIHQYMRLLEEAVILTLKKYDIDSGRIPGLTGVWLDHSDQKKARKICALGVKTSRWVTMHGFAFNVNADLKYFDYIVPCGIDDKEVTSLEQELGTKPNMNEVAQILKENIRQLFGMEFI
jgi:lipoyl(octanoyl) transferase